MKNCCKKPKKRLVDYKKLTNVTNRTYNCGNCGKTFTEFVVDNAVLKS